MLGKLQILLHMFYKLMYHNHTQKEIFLTYIYYIVEVTSISFGNLEAFCNKIDNNFDIFLTV